MAKLPTIEELREYVRTKTAEAKDVHSEQVKLASVRNYHTPVAASLHKLAEALREHDAEEVTYTDVISFADRMMR
jgi:2-C-methyl-D-erythritol 4-phosphate cytidylyltransferase